VFADRHGNAVEFPEGDCRRAGIIDVNMNHVRPKTLADEIPATS
jgi:hypothetical protein